MTRYWSGKIEEFERIYSNLDQQCGYYARHLGYLKALIENDDWIRVVEGSITGTVLVMGNSEITNALVLFNTRMFDTGRDVITLKKLVRNLPDETEIVEHHRFRMAEVGIDYETDKYLTARKEFIGMWRELKSNQTARSLRHLRDYVLAHNIEPDRELERSTLNDLIALTTQVFEVVDIAGHLIQSSRGVYKAFVKVSESQTRAFYSAMPKLSSVEDI